MFHEAFYLGLENPQRKQSDMCSLNLGIKLGNLLVCLLFSQF